MIRCERCNKLISWNDGHLENGNWTITCPDCDHIIIIPVENGDIIRNLLEGRDIDNEIRVISYIIEDTNIPKTYRAMFKRYLEWRENNE